MPRTKADRTEILRIEFGGKERELLESALGAFQFNRVATPLVSGMSDISFMIVLGTLLKVYWPDIILPTGEPEMEDIAQAIYEGIANAEPNPDRATLGGAFTDPERSVFAELLFNLTNPNWSTSAPGVVETFRDNWRDRVG